MGGILTNKVYLIDNMEFMRKVPDKFYDLAIVDPPYGIGQFVHDNSKYRYKKIDWNDNIPDKNYFTELKRISNNWIVWGYNYYTEFLGSTKRLIVWDKCISYKSNFSEMEIACFSFNTPGRIVKIDRFNSVLKEGKTRHPCQKPVLLYKWLLKNYAKPGQKIFDSHVGSGSIRIACHDMGFDFEGCELDPDYHKAQEDRYREHVTKGSELFEKDEYQQLIYE